MEFKDLKKFRGIDKAVERKENKIAKLEAGTFAGTSSISGGGSRPTGISDKVGNSAVDILLEKEKLAKLRDKYRQLAEYIESVDDIEVQEAIELYVYERRSWLNIAFIMSYSESGIRSKVKKYMAAHK